MGMLKKDLLRAPPVGNLVKHDFDNLHFRAANPCDLAAIKLNLRCEDYGHRFSFDTGYSLGCSKATAAVRPPGPLRSGTRTPAYGASGSRFRISHCRIAWMSLCIFSSPPQCPIFVARAPSTRS